MSEKALSNKEIQWAYQKWCEGYTLQQIGNALFVHPKTVSRAFNGKPKTRPILTYKE